MVEFSFSRKNERKAWRDILVDPKELAQYEEQRLRKREEIFNKVLLQCSRMIEYETKRYSATMCAFQIPEFIQGSPKYDKTECAKWMMNRLQDMDYDVEFALPCHLAISWTRQINQAKKNHEQQTSKRTKNRMIDREPIIIDANSAISRIALRARLLQKKKEDRDRKR